MTIYVISGGKVVEWGCVLYFIADGEHCNHQLECYRLYLYLNEVHKVSEVKRRKGSESHKVSLQGPSYIVSYQLFLSSVKMMSQNFYTH